MIGTKQLATPISSQDSNRSSKKLIGLPARRCFQCASVHFVNINGIPECRDCASYCQSDVIEYLQAKLSGRRLVWTQDFVPSLPDSPDNNTTPVRWVFVSPRLEYATVPLWCRCADVVEIDGERFRRLDRTYLRWLASRVEMLPAHARDRVFSELEWICQEGITAGVFGEWARSRNNWDVSSLPANWDPWADHQCDSTSVQHTPRA